MTNAELAERMRTCDHRKACDRMAEMARLAIWYESGTEADACVAYAYRCDVCDVRKERK